MISVDDAFKKFRRPAQLTDREQDDASRRHNEIREYLKTKFDIKRDFLTVIQAVDQDQTAQGRGHFLRPWRERERPPEQTARRPAGRISDALLKSMAATRFPVSVGRWLSTSASNPMQIKIPPAR